MGKLAGMAAAINKSISDKHSAFVADIADTTASIEGAKATLTAEVTAAITAINTAEGEAQAARVAAEETLKAEKAAIVEALKSESVDDGKITSLKEVEDANEAYVVKYGVGLGTLEAHQDSKVSAYELARGGVTDFTTAFAGE